eukprot:9293456-Alexandrium_andersonii.AAC.2
MPLSVWSPPPAVECESVCTSSILPNTRVPPGALELGSPGAALSPLGEPAGSDHSAVRRAE